MVSTGVGLARVTSNRDVAGAFVQSPRIVAIIGAILAPKSNAVLFSRQCILVDRSLRDDLPDDPARD
jgi:hypothetical protein